MASKQHTCTLEIKSAANSHKLNLAIHFDPCFHPANSKKIPACHALGAYLVQISTLLTSNLSFEKELGELCKRFSQEVVSYES